MGVLTQTVGLRHQLTSCKALNDYVAKPVDSEGASIEDVYHFGSTAVATYVTVSPFHCFAS